MILRDRGLVRGKELGDLELFLRVVFFLFYGYRVEKVIEGFLV